MATGDRSQAMTEISQTEITDAVRAAAEETDAMRGRMAKHPPPKDHDLANALRDLLLCCELVTFLKNLPKDALVIDIADALTGYVTTRAAQQEIELLRPK
jgi:hypothetical protein